MFSCTIHNINDILEKFITKYIYIQVVQKNIKTNIYQFMFTIQKETYFIFTSDPNDINRIYYKDVKELCTKLNVEWKTKHMFNF
jgi:hypothetical protein